MKTLSDGFTVEVLVDFVDDILFGAEAPITAAQIDIMMRRLAAGGVKRVSWIYYGDEHGGYFCPAHTPAWENYAATYRQLGNPLRVAVECGHRYGLEVYGHLKPYETGIASVFPEGSVEAQNYGRLWHSGGYLSWLAPFVLKHPELRIERRVDETPSQPIHTIKLIKRDASPTRIRKSNLQIWTSSSNFCYTRRRLDFQLSQSVETSTSEVRDHTGALVTARGEPVLVLTLSGFQLDSEYVLVTTDFADSDGDFENAGTHLLRAYDEKGRVIPGVYANGFSIWNGERIDFGRWGLSYDTGWGDRVVRLDEANHSGKAGIIAFSPGKNRYLPGALCETEPRVQKFWLECLQSMLQAGVDGIDIREESHSTHTDYPHEYGFNAVIRERCGQNDSLIPQVRGEAYTDFLRQAKQLASSYTKPMRFNLNMDYFRPTPPKCRQLAYPANIHFDWRTWIDEGLMDEAILRFYHYPFDAIFTDGIAVEMVERANRKNIPVTVNRYIHEASLEEELTRIRDDDRFSGFILYEANSLMSFKQTEDCVITSPAVQELFAQHESVL